MLTPYRSETNGIAESAVRRKRRDLGTTGSVGSFRKVVWKSNGILLLRSRHTRWQIESHLVKEDLELHLMFQ